MQKGFLAVVSVLVLATLVACGAPPAATERQSTANAPAAAAPSTAAQPSARQALIDAARQEGVLELVWGEGVAGGREGVAQLAEGLNRRYGLNLDVRFTPGPSFPEMAARIGQEYQSRRRAITVGLAT